MPKLILTKGLPASGKSTWSKQEVENSKGGTIRISKDELRLMFGNTKSREKEVIKSRNTITETYLNQGKNVIWDDTNLNPIHFDKAREITKNNNSTLETKDFTNTELAVCIERDRVRPNSVGKEVIMNMYNQYLKPAENNIKIIQNEDLSLMWIFDIDGTLAKMNDRSPYDWSRVSDDEPYEDVIFMTRMVEGSGNGVIIMSGRDEVCREATEKWLKDNNVCYDHLFMRKAGDNRPDTIIKRELFDENIKDKYYIEGVFDDRNSVVKMWRDMGLRCYEVQEGDF